MQKLLSKQHPFAFLLGMSVRITNNNKTQFRRTTPFYFLTLLTMCFAASAHAAVEYQITLKTSTNYYLVAEDGGGGDANANRTTVGPWEVFTLVDHNGGLLNSGDSVSIRTHNGHYLQALHGGGHDLSGRGPHANAWETFIIDKPGIGGRITASDKISLRTDNGHYFRTHNNGGSTLDALAPGVGCPHDFNCSWELFELDIVPGAHLVSIASGFNGKCLDVDTATNHVRMMECNGSNGQLFTQHGDGSFTSAVNNYCLDAGAHYGIVYVYPCHGGGHQRWDLANGEMRSQALNHCIDVYAFDNSDGAAVRVWHCTDASNQRWHMQNYSNFKNFVTAPSDQRVALNEELFVWSNRGNVSGMSCTAINESVNNQAVWANNYFCTTAPVQEIGLLFSSAGPITGKRCVHINEGTASWGDNYLCLDRHSKYVMHWDWANNKGPTSVRFNEPGEQWWNDNYLTIGYVGDDFMAPLADKEHNNVYQDNTLWSYFYEDVVLDQDFYCPLLNFGHYLGYAWAGCNNPNIWWDAPNNEYVIQSPHGGGYRGNETLQTRIKDLRIEMDASTVTLGNPIISPSSNQQTVETVNYVNNGDSEDVQEYRFTTTQQNCWSRSDQYTFGQSVSVTGEKKWKSTVSEVSVSVTLGLSFEQAFSESTSNCSTTSQVVVTRVTVPPRSRVEISTARITGQVTVPYSAKVNLGYTASFYNFLRWGGNAHINHPTNRPYHLGTFGGAEQGAPYKSAPAAIVDSFNEKNSLQRAYEWDWNWMFGTYGAAPLKNTMSGIMRKHTRTVHGQFTSDGTSFITTIGTAQPL